MANSAFIAVLVVALAAQAVCARLSPGSSPMRTLQAANTRCPVGCATGSCVLDETSGGYKCNKCQNSLVVSSDTGACACPAGRFAITKENDTPDCQDCSKGSYCPGADFTPETSPQAYACGEALTTVGKRSTSIRSCVNVPGTSYSVSSTGTPSATTCPADTYGPGLKKQRACVPCPPGYVTKGLTGQDSSRDCFVNQGYFLKSPGQVAPCPKGEYKSGYEALTGCTKCPQGVTTASQASTNFTDCTVLLPGWYAEEMGDSYIITAQKCPQKYFCVGGTPTAAFSTNAPTALTGTTVAKCPYGTWTEKIGSTTADQCMTPPGFYTTISGSTGTTDKCGDGYYRAEWKPAVAASTCSACGPDIYSNTDDQITVYAITPDAAESAEDVRTSASACYIKPGQGMYYSAASQTFYAANCDEDSYGGANITYGLAANPCRECPIGLVAQTMYPTSAAHYTMDTSVTPNRGGFTGPRACVTQAGFGYNGKVSTRCPVGTWNPAGSLTPCTQCGFCLSTVNDPANQVDASNCTLAAGCGYHSGAIVPCPVGTYNDVLRSSTTAACTSCGEGYTTSGTGSLSSTECSMCLPGYGDEPTTTSNNPSCGSKCGGAAGATFGPVGREASTEGRKCLACPISTGFSFDYLAQNQLFVPETVARLGADSSADCLAEYAQIVDDVWFLGGDAALTTVETIGNGTTNITTVVECTEACSEDADCMFVTFSYDGQVCQKKVAEAGSDVIAFKAVIPGESTTGASVKSSGDDNNKGFALVSGAYTFWINQNATGIGADRTSTGSTTSIAACLASCDKQSQCAAAVMSGVTSATSQPLSCVLIKGDRTPTTWKRSLTRAVTTRLSLTALFGSS